MDRGLCPAVQAGGSTVWRGRPRGGQGVTETGRGTGRLAGERKECHRHLANNQSINHLIKQFIILSIYQLIHNLPMNQSINQLIN